MGCRSRSSIQSWIAIQTGSRSEKNLDHDPIGSCIAIRIVKFLQNFVFLPIMWFYQTLSYKFKLKTSKNKLKNMILSFLNKKLKYLFWNQFYFKCIACKEKTKIQNDSNLSRFLLRKLRHSTLLSDRRFLLGVIMSVPIEKSLSPDVVEGGPQQTYLTSLAR